MAKLTKDDLSSYDLRKEVRDKFKEKLSESKDHIVLGILADFCEADYNTVDSIDDAIEVSNLKPEVARDILENEDVREKWEEGRLITDIITEEMPRGTQIPGKGEVYDVSGVTCDFNLSAVEDKVEDIRVINKLRDEVGKY